MIQSMLRLALSTWIVGVVVAEQRSPIEVWILDDVDLPCSTSQHLLVNASGWDAMLITVGSDFALSALICDPADPITVTLGSRQRLDSTLCRDRPQLFEEARTRSAFMFYDQQMTITVERRGPTCLRNESLSLAIEYQYVACWDTAQLNASTAPNYATGLCGNFEITDGSALLKFGSVFFARTPAEFQSDFTMTAHVELRIRKIDAAKKIPDFCILTLAQLVFGSNDRMSICAASIDTDVSADVALLSYPTLLGRIDDAFYAEYSDLMPYLQQHPNDTRSTAIASFYNVSIRVRYGVHAIVDGNSEGSRLLPFEFRLRDSSVEVRRMPDPLPSLDRYLHRVQVTTAPGQLLEAIWEVKPNSNISLVVLSSITTNSRLLDSTPLAAYDAGRVRSFNNRLLFEFSLKTSREDAIPSERVRELVALRFRSIDVDDHCDDVDVSRLTLETAETFNLSKANAPPGYKLICKQVFRSQTEGAHMLARFWFFYPNTCAMSTIFVIFGDTRGRYVTLCPEGERLNERLDQHYLAMVTNQVITLFTYMRHSSSANVTLAMFGLLLSTCPARFHPPIAPLPASTARSACHWEFISPVDSTDTNSSFVPIYSFPFSQTLLDGLAAYVHAVEYYLLVDRRDTWKSIFQDDMMLSGGRRDPVQTEAIEIVVPFVPFRVANPRGMTLAEGADELLLISGVSAAGQDVYIEFLLISMPRATRGNLTTSTIAVRDGDKERHYLFRSQTWQSTPIHLTTLGNSFDLLATSRSNSFIVRYRVHSYGTTSHSPLCPEGFFFVENNCYVVLSYHATSWTDALNFCDIFGSTLVTVADAVEQRTILEMSRNAFLEDADGMPKLVYVGLRRVRGTFEWTDDSVPFTFSAWHDDLLSQDNELFNLSSLGDQPNAEKGDCVAMALLRPSGKADWFTVPCETALEYEEKFSAVQICQKRTRRERGFALEWSDVRCPDGWLLLTSRCYSLASRGNVTRMDALTSCKVGVASIFNEAVHHTLYRLFHLHDDRRAVWLINPETEEPSAFRLPSSMATGIVPLSQESVDVAQGPICEQDGVGVAVVLNHHFEFECGDTSLISRDRVCDGKRDCPGREDEDNCNDVATQRTSGEVEAQNTSCQEEWKFQQLLLAKESEWIETNRTAAAGNDTGRATDHCIYRENGCTSCLHLLDCEAFECPVLFKCPQSYCVPLDRVCDGANDCPHGHDEQYCDSICRGLFRCGTRCIPLHNVCDHVTHCVDGDDERYCPRPPSEYCPSNCSCIGPIIACTSLQADLHVPAVSERLTLSNTSDLSHVDVSNAKRLSLLNLRGNNLSTIPSNKFSSLCNLLHLDVSNNLLRRLQRGMFFGLVAVEHLNLTWNPLKSIESFAFESLSNVATLDLSEKQLTVIESYTFAGMGKLQSLDLSHNQIETLHEAAFFGTANLKTLSLKGNRVVQWSVALFEVGKSLDVFESDVLKLCCLLPVTSRCEPSIGDVELCRVVPWRYAKGVLYVCAVLCTLGPLLFMARLVWRERMYGGFSLLNLLFTCNLAIGLHLISILVADADYLDMFDLNSSSAQGTNWCLASSMLVDVAIAGSAATCGFLAAEWRWKQIEKSRLAKCLLWMCTLLFVLSAVVPYFAFGPEYYGNFPVCRSVLSRNRAGWMYSLCWLLVVAITPVPLVIGALCRWSEEYAALKQLSLRAVGAARQRLAALRVLLVLGCEAMLNCIHIALWIMASFSLLRNAEDSRLILSHLVTPLASAVKVLFYLASLAFSSRYMRRRHEDKTFI